MLRVCYAIDLRDDDTAITEYERLHRPGGIWPEVVEDLRATGYVAMTIWRTGNRLMMIAEIEEPQPPPSDDPILCGLLQRWHELTRGLQQSLPGTGEPPSWTIMTCIFDLSEHPGTQPDANSAQTGSAGR